MPMNLPVSGKVCSKVRVPVGYVLGSTWVMVTGSRTCGLASSASVRNGSPFIVVWFPSSLMRRISVSMSRSSLSCMSSATTICPGLGISSQNSSRETCGWYPVKNMMSGPIRKTHRLSTIPTPPCACAAETSRTMARSHAAIPRIIIALNSHNISPAGASAPAGDIAYSRLILNTRSACLFRRLPETEQLLVAMRKLDDAAKQLQRHAEHRQREPAEEDEHPVQRFDEQFLHEPEGVAPFVEPDVREDHERADEQENIGNRPALGGIGRKPGPRIHEAAHADHDIHRVAHIELDDMARREVGVADHRHMPGAVLLREVAGTPVNGDTVDGNPADQVEDTAHFLARGDVRDVRVAGLPHPADHGEEGDQFDRLLDVEDGHPVGGEFGSKRIEPRELAENLLVDTYADIEGVEREHPDNQRNPVEKGRLGDGRGLAGACSSCYKAHVTCLFQVQALSLLAATNMHFRSCSGSCSSGLQGPGKLCEARGKGKSFFVVQASKISICRGAWLV